MNCLGSELAQRLKPGGVPIPVEPGERARLRDRVVAPVHVRAVADRTVHPGIAAVTPVPRHVPGDGNVVRGQTTRGTCIAGKEAKWPRRRRHLLVDVHG